MRSGARQREAQVVRLSGPSVHRVKKRTPFFGGVRLAPKLEVRETRAFPLSALGFFWGQNPTRLVKLILC